ncbi:hypothetical protein Mosig_000011 [Pelagibacter phage Mosig EXVC030M]|nr:hypothetical protein Mosig_000011 [Pelagibacter phage Mosig EXVC030M]
MYIIKMRISYKSITAGYQLAELGAVPSIRSI